MKIILSTWSSDSQYNGDCDYAVVELTDDVLQAIRRRVELAQAVHLQDGDLSELSFWGSTAEFYDGQLIDACREAVAAATEGPEQAKWAAADAWSAEIDRADYSTLPVGVDLAAHEAQPTECDQLIIRRIPAGRGNPDFGILWQTSPKHSDITVTTAELRLGALESLARRGAE